jgi:3-methyladenine DNA glycosylase/8-oxoguanine DNA glycosylase
MNERNVAALTAILTDELAYESYGFDRAWLAEQLASRGVLTKESAAEYLEAIAHADEARYHQRVQAAGGTPPGLDLSAMRAPYLKDAARLLREGEPS